jgi:hypothetical protein
LPALWQHARPVMGLGDMLSRVSSALFAEPDQALVRARVSSERLVASVRLGIIIFFVATNALVWISRRDNSFDPVLAVAATVYGVLLFILPRHTSAPWVPWLVSGTDVTVASLWIAQYALAGFPLATLNNRVMFDWYFVAVTLAALRFDWRLCAFTSALALAQFLGLFAYVASDTNVSTLTSYHHGAFIPVQFAGRLVMLGGHGIGTIAVALWARHLRLMVGTDQLTGLLQRRPFYERIEEELRRDLRCRRVQALQ